MLSTLPGAVYDHEIDAEQENGFAIKLEKSVTVKHNIS
jgi:hypothetical protein